MKISTKGLYAVRTMVHIAQHGGQDPVPLNDIAKSESISKKYLEQIMPNLVAAQLLRSIRGAQGGYLLARSARDITVYDILAATEGSIAPVACTAGGTLDCTMDAPCLESDMWRDLDQVIEKYLKSYSLQKIIDEGTANAADFYSI